MQRAAHRADGAGERGGDVGAGGGDHPCGEGRGVHAVLGGGAPVGVDRLDVGGVGLALPAGQELLGEGVALVDLALRHDRLAEAAGGLGGEGEHHHRDPAEVGARLLVGDVVGLLHPEHRGEHRDGGLHVGADVAGVDRDVVRLGGRQAGLVLAVDQQPPHLLEGDPADDLLDVDAAVAQRGPFLVGLGDLGLERDDTLEPVMYLSHGGHSAPMACDRDTPRSAAVGCAPWHSDTGPVRARGPAARVRRLGARPPGPGRRPGRDVPPLAARRRRRRAPRAQRDGGRPRSPPRAARRPGWCCSRASTTAASCFYTNYESRKGRELAGQPALRAAVPLARPAAPGPGRGHGRPGLARGEPRTTSPPGRAPPSSAPGPRRSREEVASRAGAGRGVRRGGGAVRRRTTCRCPPHWGGFPCGPEVVEFWQGRRGRMHDRLVYRRGRAGVWSDGAAGAVGPAGSPKRLVSECSLTYAVRRDSSCRLDVARRPPQGDRRGAGAAARGEAGAR